MQIDIKAKKLEPVRHTYSHLARRFGEDKPATRYEEAVLDIQATENFHYRPTWQPEKELYDPSRTAIDMEDWYKFLDPRQFYYGNYCITRSKQQDSADRNFKFVEKRQLIGSIPEDTKEQIKKVILPLRHFEWGANMNNTQICAMGYGTAITSAAMLHAADRLGNAQYITRIGLLLSYGDSAILDDSKALWMDDASWQGVRKMVEDSLVVEDWFELFVAQNLVMDGLLYPILFGEFEKRVNSSGGSTYSMLTEFMVNWYDESLRWVDKQIAVATSESLANKKLVSEWFARWEEQAVLGLEPLVNVAFDNGDEVLKNAIAGLKERAEKSGIKPASGLEKMASKIKGRIS